MTTCLDTNAFCCIDAEVSTRNTMIVILKENKEGHVKVGNIVDEDDKVGGTQVSPKRGQKKIEVEKKQGCQDCRDI